MGQCEAPNIEIARAHAGELKLTEASSELIQGIQHWTCFTNKEYCIGGGNGE